MTNLIEKTAWPMTPPVPYGAFHICFSVVGTTLAVYSAYIFCQRLNRKQIYRLLFLCGLVLAVSESYKQLFLYDVVNHRQYDWWYFPFQLCSLPMYLCLLLPLPGHPKMKSGICTFIKNFGLLGGMMALAEPSGLMHPYWVLTLHGLSWHILLIFISMTVTFSETGRFDTRGYLNSLLMFGFFCGIATAINIATHGSADMFYISPYDPVTQVVFDRISLRYGNVVGIVLYLFSVCIGGYLCHLLTGIIRNHIQTRRDQL